MLHYITAVVFYAAASEGDAGWCRSFGSGQFVVVCEPGSVEWLSWLSEACLLLLRLWPGSRQRLVVLCWDFIEELRVQSSIITLGFVPSWGGDPTYVGGCEVSKCVGRRSSDSHRQRYRTQLVRLKPVVLGSTPCGRLTGALLPAPFCIGPAPSYECGPMPGFHREQVDEPSGGNYCRSRQPSKRDV